LYTFPDLSISWLHNETLLAAAQKKYVYIYDNRGLEIHRLKNHIEVNKLDFLPYHYLLASVVRSWILSSTTAIDSPFLFYATHDADSYLRVMQVISNTRILQRVNLLQSTAQNWVRAMSWLKTLTMLSCTWDTETAQSPCGHPV
jgi:hypothetical protein